MSFITKRERVFNEYDLFDLPPRNEGKLKAYASCTDARAWSHFCSDKTEHLVEIIKRNNDTCRPKYVPTDVIVQTLMVAKNAEIARLKRKIEEFEQMLTAYDQLELTCDQKCEIESAHAAIKAAHKELDDLCLDLDLSGFTEGMESDAFETGKSRGDEPSHYRYDEAMSKGSDSVKYRGDELQWNYEKESPKTDTKSNQTGLVCSCDASTSADDPRIQDMQETIISKDAKLSAMQNTIAVMENDVCEPYCIYAHIYTALEKIFGVLCQNDKYKLYLNLMTAGKDTRCVDIKGKILFKLKVLEKFSLALIAPCSQENASDSSMDCACLRAEVIARIDFPQASADIKRPSVDNKRAQLVADIMENEEMKQILSKDSSLDKTEEGQTDNDIDDYSIDTENLKRLKNLQENYQELMICYEKLKYERDSLQIRCNKYEELEKEFENLRSQLFEYNALWNEKEHYRKRSLDIDSLKEQYLVLSDETSNLETQLKAESEINLIKSSTIDELRTENIALEKKLNEVQISFEKDKNAIECKLKETECTVICQEQQIKSLSVQIDRLLEHSPEKIHEDPGHSLMLIDEIESLKAQIRNLKDALYCSEDEKQNVQDEFQDKLRIIIELKMEIEDWKSSYEKAAQRNDYLEKYTDNFQEEVQRLIEENKTLSQGIKEKSDAVDNLTKIIHNKSHEMETLMNKIEKKDDEKKHLFKKLQDLQELYNCSKNIIENEKEKALEIIDLVRHESRELINNINNDDSNTAKAGTSTTYGAEYDYFENTMSLSIESSLHSINRDDHHSQLLGEIKRLHEVHSRAISNIDEIKKERNEYKESLEITKKKGEVLENKLIELEHASKEIEILKDVQSDLIEQKCKLENDLKYTNTELELSLQSTQLSKKKSEELLNKLEHFQVLEDEFTKLNDAYHILLNEKHNLQSELNDKNKSLQELLISLNEQKENLIESSQKISTLEKELSDFKMIYGNLMSNKNELQNVLASKALEINKLCNELDLKIKENSDLVEKVKLLEINQKVASKNIAALRNANLVTESTLSSIKQESDALIDKLKRFEALQTEYEKLKDENEFMTTKLNYLTTAVKEVENKNHNLMTDNQSLQNLNDNLEKSLIETKKQITAESDSQRIAYEEIFMDLQNMKTEKIKNNNKIKELLNKLDESDDMITHLNEDLMIRNNKIANLENHINALEDEIKKLHEILNTAIDTGQQISINSYEKYNSSLKGLEAHHSKAAHNIKLDLANLQKEHTKLENELSITKLRSEDSSKDKNKYLSQFVNLQNERKTIVNGIQQLEIKSMCDSALISNQCGIEDILESLNRISKSLDAKRSLEKTILNVQSSSQILLNKADEAKKLVEKEKQKIVKEKEEAIQEKIQMEKTFDDLKKALENQITRDAETIKDLEANLLNQNLISQNSITKLKVELQKLQSLYQNSISDVEILKEKIRELSEEKIDYLKNNERLEMNLKQKTELIALLQNDLENIKNRTFHDIETQVPSTIKINVSCQTDYFQKSQKGNNYDQYVKEKNTDITQSNILQSNRKLETKLVSTILPNQNQHTLNEVQILTANLEPTFDYVKSSYLNYKLQKLRPGKLEQYSISNNESYAQNSETLNHEFEADIASSFIDDSSFYSNSLKIDEVFIKNPLQQVSTNSSSFIVFDNASKNEVLPKINKDKNHKQNSAKELPVKPTINEDLFAIDKDSKINQNKNFFTESILRTEQEQFEIMPEQSELKINSLSQKQENSKLIQNNLNVETDEDDSAKPKLKIRLPRVYNANHSTLTISDIDKKSRDSSIIDITSKTNSLTNVKLSSNLENTTIKEDTLDTLEDRSMSTLSNDDNLDFRDSMGLNTTDNGSDFLQYEDTETNIYKNFQMSSVQSDNKNQYMQHEIPAVSNIDQNLSDELKLSSRIMKLKYKPDDDSVSQHNLPRVDAEIYLVKPQTKHLDSKSREQKAQKSRNFALDYILNTVQQEINPDNVNNCSISPRKIKSDERLQSSIIRETLNGVSSTQNLLVSSLEYRTISSPIRSDSKTSLKYLPIVKKTTNAKVDDVKHYKDQIKFLTKSLELTEADYKKKLEAIKSQYDSNIKNIINEHNEGVKNIQNLHEETLQDVIKSRENEVENLRTMSIEANRKVEILERENHILKNRIQDNSSTGLDEEPLKISSNIKNSKKSLIDSKMLTKTNIIACNVKPKARTHGPCSCSLDVNISDTIRNIFEQVDVEQRKMAEYTYLKYIANKILSGNVEALDAQELSFLHLKVCRTWKTKLSKEEALQKRIDNLESELINRQRHAQQHIAELDRKVEEEKRRLQEVREKVCRCTPMGSRTSSPETGRQYIPSAHPPTAAERDNVCGCKTGLCGAELTERRSAGDLAPGMSTAGLRPKRIRMESNRAVSAKLGVEERRERKYHNDELPTRLRRSHDRPVARHHKK